MSLLCPLCGSRLPYPTARYCPECGGRLRPEAGRPASPDRWLERVAGWDGHESLAGADVAGCDLTGVRLSGADLQRANLSRATLSRAALSRANLTGASLQWADLHWTDLRGAILRDADLQGALLWYTHLEEANLAGAVLQRASLRDACMDHSDLSWANLQWADLSWASLRGANLGGANLRGADLSCVDLTGGYIGPRSPVGEGFPVPGMDDWHILGEWLAHADMLQSAVLPDGTRYDGRLRLPGDLERARNMGLNHEDAFAMAAFYGVPLEKYAAGQAWAHLHLERLYG